MEEQDEYLTVQQVADELQMKARQVREAINRQELRAIRVGEGERGSFRISRRDMGIWLRTLETKPPDLALAG